jgi:hypothetical protein
MLVKATVGPVKYHPKAIAVILWELDKAAGRFDEGAVEAPLKEWRGCANDVLMDFTVILLRSDENGDDLGVI